MTIIAETLPASKPARGTGRILSGLVIVFLMIDGAIKLVPWPLVTETMDRMGYGSSETLARSLGLITIVCTVLYSIPPTSILGAILLTGYLGGAMASHVRIGSPLFTHTLFGLYLGLIHHNDAEGDAKRLAAARRYARIDGVGTECGMARGDPSRLPALLASHARAADLVG